MPSQSRRAPPETTEDRDQLLREETALRRVAMLVAGEAPQSAVFEAVSLEASRLLGGAQVRIVRADDAAAMDERTAQLVRGADGDGAVRVPVVVDGTTWGALVAFPTTFGPLPPGPKARLGDFSQLVACAIASTRARDELRSLAESQGALRRVATVVAQGAEPKTVFAAVALEAAQVLRVGAVSLISFDAGTGMFTKLFGTHGRRASVPDGGQWGLDDCPEGAMILKTGGPVRIDDWTDLPGPVAARHRRDGFGQAVAAPIIVEGAIWGHMAAFGEADEVLPPGCEALLADFTNLMASAISNAQVRDKLRGLAEQQGAALRRVATLVAQHASPSTIFNAVAREASQALRVARVDVSRCNGDGSLTLLGTTRRRDLAKDRALSVMEEYVARKVTETGRAARVDEKSTLPAPYAEALRVEGLGTIVGGPIIVEGVLWGVILVVADQLLQDDTETRLTDFTHLVASSISNVHARDSLIASRARIVTASDETRRRIERNLHDGIQQRLVAVGLSLRAAREGLPLPPDVQAGLDEVARDLEGVLEEIRIFSQGLHPALLARSGLGPSLRALAHRSPIPVNLNVAPGPRLPEAIETAVYYVVSEALANAAKHSQASEISVVVVSTATGARATVADDGAGGAVLGRGSGLIGLVDRVEALGGRLGLESPVGRGTTISIELPLRSRVLEDRLTL
jgi:signal transduction histidine kinase